MAAPDGDQELTPEQELALAYGESLLQALVAAYVDWRAANSGKCTQGDVAHAVLYFAGGCLVDLAQPSPLVRQGQWPGFVQECQDLLAEAMAFCREQAQGTGDH
jgi:hypothetical protein